MGLTFGKEAMENGVTDYYTRRPELPSVGGHYSPFGTEYLQNI